MNRVAVVQMISSSCVKENLQSLEQFFLAAEKEKVELLVLPENFAWMGGSDVDKLQVAEKYGVGEIQQTLSDYAKRYNMWIIAGTIPLQGTGNRVKASCLVYDDQGDCVAHYNKIHLFDVRIGKDEVYEESLTIEPGEEVIVVDTPVGRVGLSICYDLRFPELYRQLVMKGAEIFTVPAAFTATTGQAHWETLLKARAIENLCYVLAPNQGGLHENGRETYGHSMIIEPWGSTLAEHQSGCGIVVANIDRQHLYQLRQDFPCNEHHVLGLDRV